MQTFNKVSLAQYQKDFASTFNMSETDPLIQSIYDEIKLPKRATRKSAGYDFYSPLHFNLKPGQTIKIPTGIRVFLEDNRFLMCVPRSGLGFKFRVQLDNTIGIIDGDYVESDNEGHIFAKITNDSHDGKTVSISAGEAFMQSIILPYGITDDDDSTKQRNGGFGSTTEVSI